MIKTALVALNHANLTGNYTVLRDLGSPRFRANNDPARLAAIFSPMREDKLDASPIVLLEPQLAAPIALDDEQRLRLIGVFPTRPQRLAFSLAFEQASGRWTIADIAVNTLPAPDQADNRQEQPPLPRPRPAR